VIDKVNANRQKGICISSITLAELEYGVAKSSRPAENGNALRQFLAVIDILPFDDESTACYGAVRANLERKGKMIGALDMLIASHAKAKSITLVTNNMREFERVEGLSVENWA
jgi:tRNA(fMet)-specific endonuclease VapC